MKVVSVKVPDYVSEREVLLWVAEGLSRKYARRRVLKLLEEGVAGVDAEKALEEFEETRSEAWRTLEEEYRRKGLL